MEPKRRVLRSGALVSSVLLVGGFIAFYSGGMVFMLGSKSGSTFQHVPATEPETTPAPPAPEPTTYMGGSKSTFIFVGPGVKPPEPPKPADEPPPAQPGQ